MNDNQHLSDLVLARLEDSPRQRRSRDRLRRALEAAGRLLREGGLELCSIPEVAKASDVPRAAIYRYFPDRAALLSAMAGTSMERLGAVIREALEADDAPPGRLVERAIAESARFCDEDPVTGILLFNGPFGVDDRQSHHRKSRLIVETLLPRLPPGTSAETVALTVEIAFACLRYGYFRDGHVSPGIAAQASRAALAFLGLSDPSPRA
ncbi:TetR/AcrR family transcriptional regulator [Amaricoccus solimangrovi]|nr:TetR/AcrR family transcriptional regulator [Amaricoccus solimangrovi]